MNRLQRDLAPLTDGAWARVEDEATRLLRGFLSARRLSDWETPGGWELAGVPTGRCRVASPPAPGVTAQARQVRPLVELRAELTLARTELDAIDRGAGDPDLSPLAEAARQIAQAENRLIFEGSDELDIVGIASGSPHEVIPIPADYERVPGLVAKAVATLRGAGVDGPFAVALGPKGYTGVVESTEHGGYPVLEHVRMIGGGKVVWAPGLDGAVVVSERGGDFRLTVGSDLSIGYVSHDREGVTLFIDESLTFSNDAPEAAVVLRHEKA